MQPGSAGCSARLPYLLIVIVRVLFPCYGYQEQIECCSSFSGASGADTRRLGAPARRTELENACRRAGEVLCRGRPATPVGMEWPAVPHPIALVRKRRTGFGVVRIDRRGHTLRVTGPERTLVDGFAAPWWVGGLEELVESAAGFRDLDLDLLDAYLKLLDRRVLDAAVGWFLERHPEVSTGVTTLLAKLEKRVPHQPLYLGGRRAGGRLQRRWNILVPPQLATSAFEGSS